MQRYIDKGVIFLSSLFSLNFQFLNLKSVAPFQFVICSILDFSEALCSIVWRHLGKWRTLKLFRKLSQRRNCGGKSTFHLFNRIPERTRKETESQTRKSCIIPDGPRKNKTPCQLCKRQAWHIFPHSWSGLEKDITSMDVNAEIEFGQKSTFVVAFNWKVWEVGEPSNWIDSVVASLVWQKTDWYKISELPNTFNFV